VGNLTSIRKMLSKVGFKDSKITSDIREISSATRMILPGVGHYDYGMAQLHSSGLTEVLRQRVLEAKVPILGICLGAQLMTGRSDEGKSPGLGWIEGETVTFDASKMDSQLRVPHMGWADSKPTKSSKLFEGLESDARFYFVHSFHMKLRNDADQVVEAKHGYPFCAGFEAGNILGVQFHPEKSHRFGMRLLKNFVENYP
jgi:glutamine amidotransferase